MEQAAQSEEYERAARYRDLIFTVEQLQEKQRMAAAEGDDQDVFGYHFENEMLAVNVFHLRGGKILDRREFFWEDLPELGIRMLWKLPRNIGFSAPASLPARSSPRC